MKKIKLVLCLTACLFALNGCSILAETKPVDTQTAQSLEDVAYSLVSQIFSQTYDEQFANYLISMSPEEYEIQFENMGVYVDGSAMANGVASWITATEELGNLVSVGDTKAQYNTKGDGIIVTVTVVGDNTNSKGLPREAEVEFVFEDNYYKTINSCATNISLTFGEKMKNAGLNTLIGMGTVFAVLILLCLIISCFNIFPKLEAKKKNKTSAVASAPIAQIIEKEEMSDDSELVAVITAAIHAYESSSAMGTTDDFVVRSIKRRR